MINPLKTSSLSLSKTASEENAPPFFKSWKTIYAIIILVIWSITAFVLAFPPPPEEDSMLVLGQTAPEYIFAEFDFSYLDEKKTAAMRREKAASAPIVCRLDETKIDFILDEIREFLNETIKRKALADDGESYSVRQGRHASELVAELPIKSVETLQMLAVSEEKKSLLLSETLQTLSIGIFQGEKPKDKKTVIIVDSKGRIRREKKIEEIPDVGEAAASIAESISKTFSVENRVPIKDELAKVLCLLIKPTLIVDTRLTEEAKRKAEDSVEPQALFFKKGEPIIKKGMLIDQKTLSLYKAYRDEKQNLNHDIMHPKKIAYLLSVSFLFLLFSGIYLRHIHPELCKDWKMLTLVAIVVIINMLACMSVIKLFGILGGIFNLSPLLLNSILPLSFASLILSAMIGVRVALYAGLYVATVAALELGGSFDVVITGMFVSAVSALAVRHASNHKTFFIKSLIVVSLTIPFIQLLQLWKIDAGLELICKSLALALVNGIVSSIFCLAIIFILEAIFRTSTDMSLLVLSDYNHSLLKRLQLEAPGTYHHSLMVATLADQAARAIGASPTKARVCALFHDIGKLHLPAYFTENSMGADDKHEDLNPKLSAMVIQNHVKEGIKLAKKYKLPKIVADAIEQHHGTDMVSFFYKRAVEESAEQGYKVLDSDYKYSGPLPRQKEVVIVALADICEAASRSLSKPSPAKISELINELFRKKIRDGQLDNADMTLGELGKIKASFINTLTQMMHTRVAYPKDEENEQDDLFKQATATSATENK